MTHTLVTFLGRGREDPATSFNTRHWQRGWLDKVKEDQRAIVVSAGVPVASYSGNGGAVRGDGKWVAVTKEEVTAALASGKIPRADLHRCR
jgi:hypothetical protein